MSWRSWNGLTGGVIGRPLAPNAEDRIKVLLRIGEQRKQQEKKEEERRMPVPTSTNGGGSSSSGSSSDEPKRTRKMPKTMNRPENPPLPCVPLTRDRFGPFLREFYESLGVSEEELKVNMGAPSSEETTLRVVVGSKQDRAPRFWGSMWNLILADPLYRDFFTLLVGRYINEFVFEPKDFEDFHYNEYRDPETGELDEDAVLEDHVQRIRFEEFDLFNKNFNEVLEAAQEHMQTAEDWMNAFGDSVVRLFGTGWDGNTLRSFPAPRVDLYKVYETKGCLDVMLVDITVAKAEVEFAMRSPAMKSSLLRAVAQSAEKPPIRYFYSE